MCLQVCYETIFSCMYTSTCMLPAARKVKPGRLSTASLMSILTSSAALPICMQGRQEVHFLFLNTLLHCLASFPGLPFLLFHLHPQWYTAVKESLFHLCVLQGWPGNEAGRYGNEAGRYGNEATYQEPAWVTSLSPTMCCSFTTPRLRGCLGNAWMFCKERYYEVLSDWGAVQQMQKNIIVGS